MKKRRLCCASPKIMNGIPLPVKVEKKDYYIPYKAVNCMCISREGGRGMNHHHHPPPGKFMQTKKNYFVKLHTQPTHPQTHSPPPPLSPQTKLINYPFDI